MSPSDVMTAGTLFSHSKLPLTKCFLAIYLITQDKNSISALELKRKLGISYNAAWRIKHKLMQVMKEYDDNRKLGNIVQLDDAYIGGKQKESEDVVQEVNPLRISDLFE